MQTAKRLLTVPEASELWGLKEYTIRQAVKQGDMPYVPVGQRMIVRLEPHAIDEYIRRRQLVVPNPAGLTPGSLRRRRR